MYSHADTKAVLEEFQDRS